MSDPIEKITLQQQQEAATTPATAEVKEPAKNATATSKASEEAAGKAVSAAAKLFAKLNGLDDKKEENPKQESEEAGKKKPVEQKAEAESKADKKPSDSAEEPVNPIFGKKKSKKKEASEIKDVIEEGNRKLIESIKENSNKNPQQKEEALPENSDEQDGIDNELLQSLKKLEEIKPDYKGVSKKFIDFKKKESAYEKSWLDKNPGEEFDADSQEHSAFYQKNEPEIDESDLKAAEKALILEEARKAAKAESEKEIAPIIEEKRQRAIMEKVVPKLTKTFEESARAAAAQINKEWSNLKDLSKIQEQDPLAAQVLGEVASHWLPIIETAELAYSGAKFDPNSHAGERLGLVVTRIEKELASLSEEDSSRGGRKFATLAEYSSLPQSKRDGYWHVQSDDIAGYATYQMQLDSKKFYNQESERIEKLAASRGYVRNSGHQGKQFSEQKQTEQPDNRTFKPAPAIGGGSPAPAPSALKPDPDSDPKVRLAKRLGW